MEYLDNEAVVSGNESDVNSEKYFSNDEEISEEGMALSDESEDCDLSFYRKIENKRKRNVNSSGEEDVSIYIFFLFHILHIEL
jgi:hypothetical protein